MRTQFKVLTHPMTTTQQQQKKRRKKALKIHIKQNKWIVFILLLANTKMANEIYQ